MDIHAAGLDLRGGVALGFATLVAEGAVLDKDTVVMPESWIGPGTEIPAGFSLENAVVCQDPGDLIALPPGTERRDGLLVRGFEPAA